ncbi:AMP-binding protein [Halalkalicoccus jeotgali]|uniref:Acyl-CoA synthetase n=1 Tax=Halalkalicoccus jeotgali (strain DSM 18796 / CECT 7217 / JCM 14584 / KCTC 4019 / B3) TaxID=795797 RepID=D8J2M6_HALJB|nr:class I adenylate-forming enzyme family protein [Halalkalicoccus jeotgali]ADJ14983.1 acyl-CoA synthetase [Halalkalicoccus jeotgali B3]ELY35001.1 acyl-CoA synthetase [Halalkalicoccus jeotgali B3]
MTVSLSRRATLWGDRTAVIDTNENRRYSYADLDALADQLAGKLAGLGVGPGDRVALLSRNRIEVLAIAFAVRRVGCALAFVSPYRSKSAISDLVDRVDPETVLHEEAESDRLRKVPSTTSFAELSQGEGADYERADSPPEPWLLFQSPDEADSTVHAYSTESVERNCIAGITTWGFGRPWVANLTSFFRADGLLVGVLPALYVGGTVLLHRAFRPDPALELIERHDATHVYATPLEFDRLTDADGFETANFASVEAFYSSAPLPAECHDAYLLADHPVGRLFGTAAAPHLLTFLPEREDALEKGDSVGRPVLDCEVRLSEDRLEARGPVVAEGTLEERFEGWIETGLRARRDDDGDYWIEAD